MAQLSEITLLRSELVSVYKLLDERDEIIGVRDAKIQMLAAEKDRLQMEQLEIRAALAKIMSKG